jgi:RNA polymerase sigma factor (sigma-70 family)
MDDQVFLHGLAESRRIATVHAIAIVRRHRLPVDYRDDFEQEALLELWRKGSAFDPGRASWRTFAEHVVANRMTSLLRAKHLRRRNDPIESLRNIASPNRPGELRIEVSRVLRRVSTFDQSVALCLVDYSAVETSQTLRVSRATVYRSIGRLRAAFENAGIKR